MWEAAEILEDDLTCVEEVLSASGTYSFQQDLQDRMDGQGLSSSALARRCFVSHTMVDKWRTGKARPNGKERYKELGMALGMDAEDLNAFLLKNGYPRLYVRNPLDSAARMLLRQSAGASDMVDMYRGLIRRLKLDEMKTLSDETPFTTTVMSEELQAAADRGQATGWFKKYRHQFAGSAKTDRPDLRLNRFLLLYLGDNTIHGLAVTGSLPKPLKNLLYPVLAGKSVTVRYLREKLIGFGLYTNMTEEEIDIMLRYARLLPLSEAATDLDLAILEAVRCAHGRSVTYELENLRRLLRQLDPPGDEYEALMLEQYRQRAEVAEQMAAYYESQPMSDEDRAFEEKYTSYGDRCLMDYVYDILLILKERGTLEAGKTDSFLEIISRSEKEEKTWN